MNAFINFIQVIIRGKGEGGRGRERDEEERERSERGNQEVVDWGGVARGEEAEGTRRRGAGRGKF